LPSSMSIIIEFLKKERKLNYTKAKLGR